MKKWKIMPLIVLVILLMTGCQETPEKSAVVDKSVGLDEELILKPLKNLNSSKERGSSSAWREEAQYIRRYLNITTG